MPDASAVPSNTLTIVNPSPPPGFSNTPPSRFVLFTGSWLDMQSYITAALKLPLAVNDFTKTYGDFPTDQQQLITNTVAAMKQVRCLATDFGDPVIIKNKLITTPAYLQTETPPDEIYAHIIWLANQIQNAAGTFHYTLQSLAQFLGSGYTPQQRADNLKLILIGPGGLVSTADDMKKKTSALSTKLLTWGRKFEGANAQMQAYVSGQGELVKAANASVGKIQDQINTVQSSADSALRRWRDFTITAVSTSVGLTVLSFGMLLPLAIGMGIGFGVAAAKARESYNTLCDQVAQQQIGLRQKTQLVNDLQGFNTAISKTAPAMNEFQTNLGKVEGVWNDIGMNLAFICNNYTVEQLSNLSWVMQAMKIADAQNKWGEIAKAAQDYTQHSLVTYIPGPPFPEKLAA